jgi:hypothetical protein
MANLNVGKPEHLHHTTLAQFKVSITSQLMETNFGCAMLTQKRYPVGTYSIGRSQSTRKIEPTGALLEEML